MSSKRNKAKKVAIPESIPIDVDIRPAVEVLQSTQRKIFDQMQAISTPLIDLRLKLTKGRKPVAGARLSFEGLEPPVEHNLPRTLSTENGIGYLAIQPASTGDLPDLGIEATLKDGRVITFEDILIPGVREKKSFSSEGYTLELSTAPITADGKPSAVSIKPRVLETALVGSRSDLRASLPKLKQYACFKISTLFVVGKSLNRLPREFASYSVQLINQDFRNQLDHYDVILDLSDHAIIKKIQADLASGKLASRPAILSGGEALLTNVQAVAQALA